MSRLVSKSRGAIYWKNLGLVLLITCIPIAFIGVIIYYIGTDRIETEVNKAHQNQLNSSIQQMNDYLSNLEHSVVRLAFDRSMDETLKQLDFVQDFQVTNDIMKTFSLITESNSLINSVSLYLRGTNKIMGDEVGFQTIRTEDDLNLLNSLLDNERTIYWNYALKKINKPDSQNKAIIIKLPGGQMYGSFGMYIIYLDQKKLNTMVQKLVSGEGVAFLFNENGDDLTTSSSDEGTKDQQTLKDTLKNRINADNANENRFKFEWDHKSYNVSYGKISKLGSKWTVVTATPVSQIIAPVRSLSSLIVWISVLGLTLGLLLSWFASNKIYDPIQRLKSLFEGSRTGRSSDKDEVTYIEHQWKLQLQQQQELSIKLKQSTPMLRESFLLQFLQGHLYTHTESELVQKMKQFDWDIEQKKFAIMVAQLHGMTELGGKFSERDDQLVSFAASNIITELCSEKLNMVHVTNFQDLSIGVFLVLDPTHSKEEIAAMLNKLAHDYIVAVNNVLRLKVTIVTSKISDSIVEMPKILEQTRKALRFRDHHTSNQMLDMNQYLLPSTKQNQYPSELEREIVHTVSMGLEEEAAQLIKKFMLELQSNNNAELMVHQGMMKLLGSIHDAIVKHDVNLFTLYEGVHLYEQLMQLSEPDQIVEWFQYQLIRPFVRTLTIAYDANLKEMIDDLLVQMQKDVFHDVSLEMYADQFQISPSKLSKAFKQINGINFIDMMVRLRLEKCKELLVTTDLKINDIADQLHYQPSYLIRMFKKYESLTPRQYREKHT
ncbi:helix-turn-helix domain-containing protein [Paenibacillus cremeus]|nr:helix-turn-helix transcriptional regulator [Paenibacillus cremeus]